MSDAETSSMLRAVLDEVCGHLGQYQTAVRAQVAAHILAAAGREITVESIKEIGRDALKTAPTMWR